MTSLVYAYGCGRPVSGLEPMLAEHARCVALWNALVAIDRAIEADELARACADDDALRALQETIGMLSATLLGDPDNDAARAERRAAYGGRRDRLRAWRAAHKPVLRALERWRLEQVVDARRATDAWWPNYNRVLRAYDTGRQVNRRFGRRLRLHDQDHDGVLAYQIQRTRSGLGAAPPELMEGSVAALQVGIEPVRGRRSRMLEMRVDAAGSMARLPVFWHRPLPDDCRVKAAELTWRRTGGRLVYQVCFTLSLPATAGAAAVGLAALRNPARLAFGWRPRQDGSLQVMTLCHGGGEVAWSLPDDWVRRAALVGTMTRRLREAFRSAREAFEDISGVSPIGDHRAPLATFGRMQARWSALPDEQRAWLRESRGLWNALTGLRTNVLRHRRELYRQMAREIVRRHPLIALPDLDLAALARAEQGSDDNARRHLAAIHTLRSEIIHQARKAGCRVLASGHSSEDAEREKSGTWQRRKAQKLQRSQTGEIVSEIQ